MATLTTDELEYVIPGYREYKHVLSPDINERLNNSRRTSSLETYGIPGSLIHQLLCTSHFALQTDWRCSIGDTGIQLFETPQCYQGFFKRKPDMTPKKLICDLDSQVHCLPAVFL